MFASSALAIGSLSLSNLICSLLVDKLIKFRYKHFMVLSSDCMNKQLWMQLGNPYYWVFMGMGMGE